MNPRVLRTTAGGLRAVGAAVMLTVAMQWGAVHAADGEAKLTTAGVKLGGLIAGPDVTKQSMEGRVVLLEYWGVRNPASATTMPAIEQLHRTLGPQGLLVIGAHQGRGNPEDMRKAIAAMGVTFSIVERAPVEGPGPVPQAPCTLLFDHTGICVFRGTALEAGAAATAAVNAAPPQLLAGRPLKKLTSLYPQLKNEALFGAALRKARGLASSKDAETAEEATFVVEKLEAWGRDIVEQSPEARDADPVRAFDMLQRCAIAFRGDAIGNEATKLVVALKKDPGFQAVVKCGQQLAKLESLRAGLLGGGTVVTPDMPAAAPVGVKRQMKDLVDAVQRGAPGSKMAERAAEIAMEWRLDAPAGR